MVTISDKARREAKNIASRNGRTYTDGMSMRRVHSSGECERAALEMYQWCIGELKRNGIDVETIKTLL